jgi:threonine aldolase
MPLIDLRSDTVTKPTPAMRRAMFEAEVGDDVYQEDPTVNRLEARAAEVLGKEAALFVPTGCMGNTIGIKLLTRHGEEVIAEARGHLLNYELSMAAWFSGCLVRPVAAPDGILTWDLIAPQVRPRGPHWAATGCIELENTHNMAGGTVYPQDVFDDVCDRAHALGLRVHLDGARLFNAAAALGRPVAELCAKADTVMVCLSKGLGAPVGSMLAGPAALMDDARLYRKRLGGGMRQAGILAAAGLIALEQMPARLGEDHANARFLAEGLGALPGVRVVNPEPATNIVVFEAPEPARLSAGLKARGVLINPISETALRAVTHYDVSREDCAQALAAMQEALTPCRSH